MFGDGLSTLLENVEGKKEKEIQRKRQRILQRVLYPNTKQKFRDPMNLFKKGG